MKLTLVQTRDKVSTGGPGDHTSRLTSDPGNGSSQGWALDYEAGIVTAVRGEFRILIPVGNVAFMKAAAKGDQVMDHGHWWVVKLPDGEYHGGPRQSQAFTYTDREDARKVAKGTEGRVICVVKREPLSEREPHSKHFTPRGADFAVAEGNVKAK